MDYSFLPSKDQIDRYAKQRVPVGSFLAALLSNDLSQTVACADDVNINLIPEYVRYLYNNVPSACWGSPEKVDAWLKG